MALRTVRRESATAFVDGDIADVAASLQDVLGPRITAAIAGVHDASAVGKWARRERRPRMEAERRLRDGWRVTQLLLQLEPPAIARAWLVGLNRDLGDRVPVLAIADDPVEVMRAARAFLAHG